MNALTSAAKRAAYNHIQLSDDLLSLVERAVVEFVIHDGPRQRFSIIVAMYFIGTEHSYGGDLDGAVQRAYDVLYVHIQNGKGFPDDLKTMAKRILDIIAGLGISTSVRKAAGSGLLAAYWMGLEAGKGTEHAAMYRV